MKKVGFFGGTFDPIHFGHLNLAINLLEKGKLDHILFSPANVSPEKVVNPPLSTGKCRKEMVELAIKEIPGCSVLDIELSREGPSFTIDTIEILIKENPNTEYFIVLGEDVLPGLDKWKDVKALFELAPPLVGARKTDQMPSLPTFLLNIIDQGRVDIPLMEISSTDLRERLLKKKFCRHLVPAEVLDYINHHGLY